MEVSGSLKRKAINKYRENTWAFDQEAIYFGEASLDYNGLLTYPAFDEDIDKTLQKRQESYITKMTEIIRTKAQEPMMDITYINKVLNLINGISRKYAFALLEELNQIVNAGSNHFLYKFYTLVEYLKMGNNQTQIQFELILRVFRQGKHYGFCALDEELNKYFPLYAALDKLSEKLQTIITMGMFIAPDRITALGARDIDNEISAFYLPIYFLIKDDALANAFLIAINEGFKDIHDVIENARDLEIPRNLIRRF